MHCCPYHTATNYCGTANNAGAILVLGRDLTLYPKLIHPLPPSALYGRGSFDLSSRGLHSFTSQLNLSASYGIGGARRGGVVRVKGVCRGCVGGV
jgi:hypothetical protein